jgi:hypothetical protein
MLRLEVEHEEPLPVAWPTVDPDNKPRNPFLDVMLGVPICPVAAPLQDAPESEEVDEREEELSPGVGSETVESSEGSGEDDEDDEEEEDDDDYDDDDFDVGVVDVQQEQKGSARPADKGAAQVDSTGHGSPRTGKTGRSSKQQTQEASDASKQKSAETGSERTSEPPSPTGVPSAIKEGETF